MYLLRQNLAMFFVVYAIELKNWRTFLGMVRSILRKIQSRGESTLFLLFGHFGKCFVRHCRHDSCV